MKRGGFAPRLVSNLSRSTSYAVPKSAVQPLSKFAQHLVAREPEKGELKRALIHTLPHLVAVLMGALVFTYLGALLFETHIFSNRANFVKYLVFI